MVGSFYDPVLDEGCAFEELISFHGGLGGPQTRPFILLPAVACRCPTEPIARRRRRARRCCSAGAAASRTAPRRAARAAASPTTTALEPRRGPARGSAQSGTQAKRSGFGPMRAALAPVERVDRARPASALELEVEQREVLRASAPGVVDFGKTMLPRWMCQRSTTCAGVRPSSLRDRRRSPGRRAPRPARSATRPRWRCRARGRRRATSSLWKYGCSSIWLTAGTTSRLGGEPLEMRRPGSSRRRSSARGRRAWNSSSVFHVETKSPS